MPETRTIPLDRLPEPIARYTTAHRAHDTATAITAFAGDATVLDDRHTYSGTEAIRQWLDRSATEFTYTITPTGAQAIDATHYVVTQHLEGDFPGGAVDLRYQFTLTGDHIQRLAIEP